MAVIWHMKPPKAYYNSSAFPRKIGLNLGIEYLIRSGIIKSFIDFPCCIFVKNGDQKVVVTINPSNDKEYFCVRNWLLYRCRDSQPIPPMEEHMVSQEELYKHKAVILEGYSPLYFDCRSVKTKLNKGNGGHPMSQNEYAQFFENMLNPYEHFIKKERFLWKSFTDVHIPSIEFLHEEEHKPSGWHFYVYTQISPSKKILQQMELVRTNFKTLWQYWIKWKKFMLFFTTPGELIFMNEYNLQ